MFDKDWYLRNNPDVAQAAVNPMIHYLRHGGFEGRDPGPSFSNKWYLDAYEDVRKAGINPLAHYLRFGRREGRQIQPSHNTAVKQSDAASALKRKIFCIGLNKTGTTSLEQILKEFGYKVGDQWEAESLMDDWAVRNFDRIIRYCETADAFQDVPFSLDFTYQILDHAFPGSKFILTIRKSAEEWYRSLVRFHSNLMGLKGVPTVEDLKHFPYHEKGWMWKQQQHIFGATEATLYDEKLYKAYYINHNNQVLEYFRFRPQDLLVLNLSEASSMQRLCEFLGVKYTGQVMPHLNRSINDAVS